MFEHSKFTDTFKPTIGADFSNKEITINGRIVTLQIWDTAGQERFKSLIHSYIKDSAVAIVVFDITSRQSFQSVEKWIEDARNLREDDCLLILTGNKADLADQR